jgi:Rab proteins geranylgeranyltransferase component A
VQSAGSTPSHHSHGPEISQSHYVLTLEDFPDPITCRLIVSSNDYAPPSLYPSIESSPPRGNIGNTTVARCIAIIDQPISFGSQVESPFSEPDATPTHEELTPPKFETSVLIFPPSSLDGGSSAVSVNVLITGADSMSAPEGKCMLLTLQLSVPFNFKSLHHNLRDTLYIHVDS